MPEETIQDIEERVQMNRAALAQSLNRLSDALAPDRLKQETSATVKNYGSEVGRQLWDGARANPAAFSLVAAGIALLLSGAGKRSEDQTDDLPNGQERQSQRAPGNEQPVMMAQQPYKAQKASRMRATLHRGLDKLPHKARERVVAARIAAIDAQNKLEQRAIRARNASLRAVQDQPVTCAAAAFGIGALAASLTPSTDTEDALLGAHRDALMSAAAKALREEFSNLKAAAIPRENANPKPQEAGYR